MADSNLGNLYYTVGMKGIADAKKQLAELSEAIKKGAISGPLPTAADFANKDAVGEKFANSILEKTKLLQSSLEKALRASDQKTAARLNSELRHWHARACIQPHITAEIKKKINGGS